MQLVNIFINVLRLILVKMLSKLQTYSSISIGSVIMCATFVQFYYTGSTSVDYINILKVEFQARVLNN